MLDWRTIGETCSEAAIGGGMSLRANRLMEFTSESLDGGETSLVRPAKWMT